MLRTARPMPRLFRGLAPLLVGGAFYLTVGDEAREAWPSLVTIRPEALLVLPLFLLWNQVASVAWQGLLSALDVRTRLGDLVRLRIEAQAVNQVVPAAGLAGEALRVARSAGPGEVGAASTATALDNAAGLLSGLVFAIGATLAHSSAERRLLGPILASLVGMVLVLGLVALPFVLAKSVLLRFRTGSLRRAFEPFADKPVVVRRAFARAVGLRVIERLLGALEIWVALAATGHRVSVWDAAFVAAALVLVSFAAFFVPGQLGAAEVTGAAAATLVGLPAAAGLSAVLVRRGRQLVVCVGGAISLALRARGATPEREASLVPERLDGVHARGAARRQPAEHHADPDAERRGAERPDERKHTRPAHAQGDHVGDGQPQENAQERAKRRQDQRLCQKQPADLAR